MGARFDRHKLASLLAPVAVAAVAVVVLVVATGGQSATGLKSQSAANSFISAVVRRREAGSPAAQGSRCTRLLTSALSVLARAQAATDRLFDPVTAHVSGVSQTPAMRTDFKLVPALDRMARALPNGDRVFLAVYAPTLRGVAAATGDLVDLYVAGRQPQSASFGGEASEPFLTEGLPQSPIVADHTLLELVPNGVAAVRWRFPSLRVPKLSGHPGKTLPGGTLVAHVVGNVAAADPIPGILPTPSTITWLAHDGHVIKTLNEGTPKFQTSTTGSSVTVTGTVVGYPISRC